MHAARLALAPVLAAVVAVVAAACGTVGVTSGGDISRGKQLFEQKCASCHTLADAGSKSTIGPDLDAAFDDVRRENNEESYFDESTIRAVVRDQIAYPIEDPVTDAPGMPANLVTGADADAVASYVASVAGKTPAGGGGDDGGGTTDGRAIFLANCASCHTLAAAGSEGTIGPNLDESHPSRQLAIDRITNGRGQMPPFRDQLSEEQIRAVAEFVVDNAGR